MVTRRYGGLRFWALGKFHYMREHLEIVESTQVKYLLGKISTVRQSAGNQISSLNDDKVGSSETTRGTLDNSDITHKLNFDSTFRNWFIGFTDAEGCFTCSVLNRTRKTIEDRKQVQVRYILSQKGELELLTEIAKLLGGKISYLKSYEGYNMTVNLLKLSKVICYFTIYPLKSKI